MLRLSLLLLCVIVFTSCQKKNTSGEMRSPGEIAFKANCQTCHILPKATMKIDAEWPYFVGRYGEKAKLSEEKKADIIAYLTSHN